MMFSGCCLCSGPNEFIPYSSIDINASATVHWYQQFFTCGRGGDCKTAWRKGINTPPHPNTSWQFTLTAPFKNKTLSGDSQCNPIELLHRVTTSTGMLPTNLKAQHDFSCGSPFLQSLASAELCFLSSAPSI